MPHHLIDFETIARYEGRCPMEVTRDGHLEECGQPTVALRWIDCDDGHLEAVPVCVRHIVRGEMVDVKDMAGIGEV